MGTDVARQPAGVVTPVVCVVVHPVDTQAHPTYPPGWRWSVMLGDGPWHELGRCANSGWCPTRGIALAEADQNAATAVQALRLIGLPFANRPPIVLDHDPIPAEAEQVTTV